MFHFSQLIRGGFHEVLENFPRRLIQLVVCRIIRRDNVSLFIIEDNIMKHIIRFFKTIIGLLLWLLNTISLRWVHIAQDSKKNFQRVIKKFMVTILQGPDMLNPINNTIISRNGIRTIDINSKPNIIAKSQSLKIWPILSSSRSFTIYLNSRISQLIPS